MIGVFGSRELSLVFLFQIVVGGAGLNIQSRDGFVEDGAVGIVLRTSV